MSAALATTTATESEKVLVPRVSAMHRLGAQMAPTADAHAALESAGLTGWNVRKTPLYVNAGMDMELTAIADKFGSVRDNPRTGAVEYLGVVGNKYTPIQNESYEDLLNTVMDETGATVETAGELNQGRNTFVSMKMPEQLFIGGEDPVDSYIAAFNSHDGRSAFQFAFTNIRVFCANQQSAVMRGAKERYTVRHTRNHEEALVVVRDAMRESSKYLAAFKQQSDMMLDSKYTEAQFAKLTAQLLGEIPAEDSSKKAVRERAQQQHSDLMGLFTSSPTAETIRGTKWAAYQAFTEYADFYSPIRAKVGKDEIRSLRVVSGATDEWKSRAFAALAS